MNTDTEFLIKLHDELIAGSIIHMKYDNRLGRDMFLVWLATPHLDGGSDVKFNGGGNTICAAFEMAIEKRNGDHS